MSYAANLGRDRIITLLRGLGATDVQHAFDRACLQGKIETARRLYQMGARPSEGAQSGCCETLNDAGLGFLIEHGARLRPEDAAQLLQTYSRAPAAKHRCMELLVRNGFDLPDTPVMAVHRGRIDLHLCVDFDELDLASFLIDRGADVNARARFDAEGFGGHTSLFGCVVSQPYLSGLRTDDSFARLLLDRGGDPSARASLRKRLRFFEDDSTHEYRDVTPLSWGARFHGRAWVNEAAMKLIAARGGLP
jgi:hypothetical protein